MEMLDIGNENLTFYGLGICDTMTLPPPKRPEDLPRPAPKPNTKQLLTYPQAALELGVRSLALGNLISRGTLTNVGGRGHGMGRIDPDELAALIERRAGRIRVDVQEDG